MPHIYRNRWAALEPTATSEARPDALASTPPLPLDLPAAARVFEASGIADAAPGTGPASSSETELSTRGHYREELLRVVRGCNKAERLINKAEIGAKAAEALAQLRSSATTVRKLLSQPGSPAAPGRGHRPCAPRPASASPGRAGRFDLPPDVPGASRPASPSPARGGAAPEPWIPPGYDGLDAAAARERQATASEASCHACLPVDSFLVTRCADNSCLRDLAAHESC